MADQPTGKHPGERPAAEETPAYRWMAENKDALLSSNAHVERHGLPLARYRQF